MNDGAIWLTIRLFLHVVTVWSLVSYMHEARTKCVPTVLAILGGGCSAAAFFQGVTGWDRLVGHTEPWLMGITFVLAAICVLNGGNTAKPLPKALNW